MQTSAATAKITRPRLSGIFQRDRIFSLLDAGSSKPVIWVAAPAGSGKTTLVASYLDARKLPCLWYQLDQGDGDLAGFFHYLGLAGKKAAPRFKKPFPHLTPEYLLGIPVFTRRFFETLFQRLPNNCVVVFDDYQGAPEGTGFHEMMVHALDVVPRGNQVIIISRSAPPAQLARLRANSHIRLLGWDEIRFTREESGELLSRHGHGKPADELLEALHRKTEGWAAGLILLMTRSGADETAPCTPAESTNHELFDYFANEIFIKTSPEIREVLTKTAILQKIEPRMATVLTGIREAGQILDDLSRGHYFTQQYDSGYQYHPLFREFLLTRATSVLSPDEIVHLRSQAALLLEESGRIEEAVTLYREAEEWDGLIRLILGHAHILLEQGRWKTLNEWLTGLPPEIVDTIPWLIFWLGVSQMPFSPPGAVAYLEKSYQQFAGHEDGTGMLLSCSNAIDSIVQGWDDFTLLDVWIRRTESGIEVFRDTLMPDCAARTMLSLAAAMVIRQPFRPDLEAAVERALVHARGSKDVNVRFQAHLLAQNYYCWMGDLGKSRLMSDESDKLSRAPAVSPLLRLTWIWIDAILSMVVKTADSDKMLERVEEAFGIAEETGVHAMDHMLTGLGANAALLKGDTELAKQFIERFQAQLDPTKRHAYALCHYEWAWHHLLTGNHPLAISHTAFAVRIAQETGYIYPEMLCRLAQAQALHAGGESVEAQQTLNRVGEMIEWTGSLLFRFNWLLVSAHFSFARHDERAGFDFLREAVTIGRKNNFNSGLWWWHPEVMSDLCGRALEGGMEPGYVERMIRNHRLLPPAWTEDLDCWPRPLRLFTLGRFELNRDGRAVDLAGKRKVIELLKALVSLEGTAIRQERVTDLLWPGADGDDGHNSFKMTLSRLRRLLPDEAIHFQDGILTLNRRLLWADVWAFERLYDDASGMWLKSRETGNSGKEAKRAIELTHKALSLYAGSFLPGDLDQPWTVSQRERLRTKLLRLTLITGKHHEEKGKWNSAVGLYRQGLDVDPLQEEFYQRLMICHHQLGQRTEALAVYERCRAELSVHLKIKPSPRTEELYAALLR